MNASEALGQALSDPSESLRSLCRVGVSFGFNPKQFRQWSCRLRKRRRNGRIVIEAKNDLWRLQRAIIRTLS